MSARRVVVTGVGAVSPLGSDGRRRPGQALVAGRSGVGSDHPVRPGGVPRSHRRRGAAASSRTRCSAGAGPGTWTGSPSWPWWRRARPSSRPSSTLGADPDRVGVVFGTGHRRDPLPRGRAWPSSTSAGPEWVSPYTLPMMIPNMVAGEVAMEWGIRGYSSCPVTACSASAPAIGEGLDLIRAGRADAVVCGGSEAPITRVAVAGFAAMKALSTRNDDPERASRPFDAGRDGFVMGEGAAVLVLEERDVALRRGAPILAELAGYGATTDAYHMTAAPPRGRRGGAGHAAAPAEDAGVEPDASRLRQRPRYVDATQRPDRDAGAEAAFWGKGPPGVVDQVHDRAHAGRGGRAGSRDLRAGPQPSDPAADHQPGAARPRLRPGLRAPTGPGRRRSRWP